MRVNYILFATMFFVAQSVLAESPVQHYKVEKPASVEAAVESFEANFKKIEGLLSAESVSVAELEQVHYVSYSLEVAVEKMREEKDTAELKELADVVEELHLSSEKHQAAETKKWKDKVAELFAQIKKVKL